MAPYITIKMNEKQFSFSDALVTLYVFNIHMWRKATTADSPNLERFHHHRAFCWVEPRWVLSLMTMDVIATAQVKHVRCDNVKLLLPCHMSSRLTGTQLQSCPISKVRVLCHFPTLPHTSRFRDASFVIRVNHAGI